MNAKSLGDFFGDLKGIFHNVAASILKDLLDLAIQMFIMRPIAQALFGGGQAGAGGAQGGGGGIWGTVISGIGSALGAVFGGGGGFDSGSFNSTVASNSAALNAIPMNVGYATGTHYFSGGAAWVGEHGPEMVSLPRGSRITPAGESRRLAAANDSGPRISLTNHNDFRGADPAAVAAIEQKLGRMEAELPGRVVQAYQDAKSRFVIR